MTAANTAELTVDLDQSGPAAPPRSNGELVFAEPWESRAFGLGITLAEAGLFTWDDFREHLVAAIDAWTATAGPDADYHYYERWVEALQSIVVQAGVTSNDAVDQRILELLARPAGHDHRHDDDGDDHHHHHH